MVGRKRARASQRKPTVPDFPDVYREMLAEAAADAGPSASSEPPPKKLKRPGERKPQPGSVKAPGLPLNGEDDEGEEEDIQFEDVVLPAPTVQTIYRDSGDEESDDQEVEFEDVDFGAVQPESGTVKEPEKLTLNLSIHAGTTAATRTRGDRRKPITKEERERRISIHKAHVLCLLLHCAIRNRWCDDKQVQASLRPLLPQKTVDYLNPASTLPQFGQTESLKTGLQQAGSIFKSKFQVTERGLRRSLWSEDPEHLAKYELPSDMDSCMDRQDFRDTARKLHGSRDIGAQLYCSLLRSAGVRARLVCSLQPLSFSQGGPTLPKPRDTKTPTKHTKAEQIQVQLSQYSVSEEASSSSDMSKASPLRRLGHPNAAAYQLPLMPVSATVARKPTETPKRIRESPYPVYWVEVLDVAHQKWQPVDPLVTNSLWKPRALEPPASDRENCLSYVVAFELDGTVRDVTRRYAKAYAAKTRRLRVETADERGDRWWRKALKPFARRWPTDLDQIEDNELTAIEGREPMPRNVADFKDHPVFALERHLRRNEVLIPGAQPAGTVAAGSKAPLEKVYRRKDVRIARSRDKWYRMGREVKPMEVPVKFLPRRANAKPGEYVDDGYGGDERDAVGMPVFMEEQTELYRPSPVVNGRVPKNKFGNIDIYVPSMVPEGGIHIADEFDTAARAAYILGIDYAPALTGFQFKGKHGTAVINGVVVAREYQEAVKAVMDGLGDMDAQAEQSKRSQIAIKLWKRFLTALRIRERIWAGVDPDERAEEGQKITEDIAGTLEDDSAAEGGGGFMVEDEYGDGVGLGMGDDPGVFERDGDELEDAPSDVTEEYDMEEDGGGGGFLVE